MPPCLQGSLNASFGLAVDSTHLWLSQDPPVSVAIPVPPRSPASGIPSLPVALAFLGNSNYR